MIEIDYKKAENLEDGIKNLYKIITLLRSDDGCPWDRKQNNKSVSEALLDEVYEYLNGVIKKDVDSEREEIGDILLNVFMTLYIHEENGDFKAEDALNEVCEKLIRRHPHVFTNGKKVENPEDVLKIWNSVKDEERKGKDENIFSHIPSSLPPLEEGYEIQKKMKKVGFDFKNYDEIFDKIYEEINEVKLSLKNEDKNALEMEIGDLLFSVINLSRFLKIKASTALFRSNEKIKNRFLSLSRRAEELDIELSEENIDVLNKIWDEVKREEN